MTRGSTRLDVCYVDGLEDGVTPSAAALESVGAYAVTQLRTVDEAVAALDDDAFDCLVASTRLADGACEELLAATRDAAPDLPVVVVGPDPPSTIGGAGDPEVRVVETGTTDDSTGSHDGSTDPRDGSSDRRDGRTDSETPVADGCAQLDPAPVQQVVAAQIDRLVDRPEAATLRLDGLPRPAFVYDDGFVDWNPAFASLVGPTEATLSERSLADVFDCAPTDLASAAADGEPIDVRIVDDATIDDGDSGDAAIAGRDSDGAATASEVDDAPVADEATDWVALSVGRDAGRYVCLVEERHERAGSGDRSNERSRRFEYGDDGEWSAESMLDSFLEGIPLAAYFKDRRGRHVAVSDFQVGKGEEWAVESPEGTVHHVPADVVGKTDFDLYGTETAERAAANDDHVMETEEPHVAETQIHTVQEMEGVTTTGTKNLAMTTIKAPWYDETGEVVGVVGLTINETDKWEFRQRAVAGDAILETIQEMLNGQLGSALGVPAPDAGPEADAPGEARLERLRSDLQTLLRTRQHHESTELVDLGEAARAAWTELDHAGATLDVDVSSVTEANPRQLRVLLTELLDNAVVHGGSESRVVVGELEEGFYVEDDGPGVDPARREQVFEYGTSTDEDRLGGGLAVVEALAIAHGWSPTITDGALGGARVVISNAHFY